MTSWFDEMLYGLFRSVGLFLRGAPVFGSPASDATFFRRGTFTRRRKWPGNSWSMRPGWQVLLVRLMGIAAVVAVVLWRWPAAAVVVVVVLAVLGYVLWRKPWRNWAAVEHGYDPIPLFEGLRPILGIPDSEPWQDWLGIPDDIDYPERVNPVFLQLPVGWSQTDPRHEHVVQVATHYLPGHWTPVWYEAGYVEFHPVPTSSPPPAGVSAEDAALPSYQPPDIDPLFAQQVPIVIDGDEATRHRRAP